MRHRTPALHELLFLQPGQVFAQRTRELRRLTRRAVPEQHHFAAVHLHNLHVVNACWVGQWRRREPAAGDDKPVAVAGLHAEDDPICCTRSSYLASLGARSIASIRMRSAARSSASSPSHTCVPTSIAGTSLTPAVTAAAVVASRRPAVERISAPR